VVYPKNNNYQNNTSQGWRSNHNQGFGSKQDVGPSNSQAPFQQQPLYPSIQERTIKLEGNLEKFMQTLLSNQKNSEASIKKFRNTGGTNC